MKSTLSALMEKHKLDALLVTGPGQHNPAMVYLTGGGHLTHADLIVKRGADPLLFFRPMERDEAARTGLQTKSLEAYDYQALLKECKNNSIQATARRYQLMLADAGVTSGKVALAGQMDAGTSLAVFSALQSLMPEIKLAGEKGNVLLLDAMMTKDEDEIERIRRMGKITVEVVGRIAEFLGAQNAKDNLLVMADGSPVTIGMVKKRINLWLAELGAENPEGTIFAQGYDSAIPHSTGTDANPLRLGETIVFDIFPCEAGGGYFYDFTRTWCLGHVPDDVLAIYEQVYEAYHLVVDSLQVEVPFKQYQLQVCEFFEGCGHPSILSDPHTPEGYVHSVGHGLGLHVHERPWSGATANDGDILAPGTVVTVEPGLYYPDRKIGVRLENTVWMRPDGVPEVLVEYPMDLLIPLKG